MTALAQERSFSRYGAGGYPNQIYEPIGGTFKIWKGSMVMLVAGYARVAAATAGGVVFGVSTNTYDNTAGANGAIEVVAEQGVFPFLNSAAPDAITQADAGKDCYVADDQTVARTNAGNRPRAGRVVRVDSGTVWVFIGMALGGGAEAGPSAAFSGRGVRGASTADIADLAAFTVAAVDGLTYVAGERILLKNQTTTSQNGIYVVGTVTGGVAPLTRALDADGEDEVVPGLMVHVSAGTVGIDSWFFLTSNAPITVGTTALVFLEVPSYADLAGTGGAALVGILDTAALITATETEGALAEIFAKFPGITKLQIVTGTFVAGLCTITVGAGQAVTAATKGFPCMSAVVTGSANVGTMAHMLANNVVGGSGVGQVLFRILDTAGGTDVDAAGLFAAILIN